MIEQYNVFYIASEAFEYRFYVTVSLRTQTTIMKHSKKKFLTFDRPNLEGFQLQDVDWWFIKNNAFIGSSPYRSLHYYIHDKGSYEMVRGVVVCIKKRTKTIFLQFLLRLIETSFTKKLIISCN